MGITLRYTIKDALDISDWLSWLGSGNTLETL